MKPDWGAVELTGPEPGWVEVDETGWGALKVLCAGTGNRGRTRRDDTGRVVRAVRETHEGPAETFEPFTAEDLRIIEDSIDSYILEAGALPLPHGCRWFLRIPDGFEGDLLAYIDVRLNSALTGGTPQPSDWLRELQPIMVELYGD